jgi:hypothetical protein
MTPPEREGVQQWSPEERRRVARSLDELVDRPMLHRQPRQRRVEMVVACAGAAILIPWIGFLSVSLPRSHSVRAWNLVWIGFDIAVAVCLGVTGWWVLQRCQVAMFGLVVAATLLLCDAWFDVCRAWNTADQTWALLSAVVEVSVAALLASSALRIVRRTSRVVRQLRGEGDGPDSVWKQRFVMVRPDA